MSAMCKVPAEVTDELWGVECRVAFLKAAICALSELEEGDLHAQTAPKTWQGLFYWTQDLEDLLRRLNDLANPA